MLSALLLQAAAAVTCPVPAPPPPELAAWEQGEPVAAAASVPGPVPVGAGVRATLLPAAAVTLAVPNTRPLPPGSSNGVFSFIAPSMGRYRVALGRSAWIEVIAHGQPLPAKAHNHGPACSPVRKMVDFDLQPGRHLLQIVGSDRVVLSLMIVKLP